MKRPTLKEIAKQAAKTLSQCGIAKAHLPTPEALQSAQTAMLARLERFAPKCKKWWRKLKRCSLRKTRCPNTNCSAACWFGGRLLVQRTVAEAAELLEQIDLSLWFVTVVHPNDRVEIGQLERWKVEAPALRVRRALRKLEAFGPVWAAGGLDVSFEDGPAPFWSPHWHLIIATKAPKEEIRAAFHPRGGDSKSVTVKRVHDLTPLCGYAFKSQSVRHVPILSGRRKARDKIKLPLSGKHDKHRVEHDCWVHHTGTRRLIFYGLKRIHGVLVRLR